MRVARDLGYHGNSGREFKEKAESVVLGSRARAEASLLGTA